MPNKINARYIEGLPVIGFGQTYQNVTASISVLVPAGSTYAFAGQRNQWFELR